MYSTDRFKNDPNARVRLKTNYNIQALRAVAAYAVVGHHVVDALRNYVAIDRFNANPNLGSTGVNLFFVISGYIMMSTTMEKSIRPIDFLVHRAIRVAPLYWMLSLIAVAITACGFALFGHAGLSSSHVIRSFLFLPEFAPGSKPILPVLFVGWTLNYEIFFYVQFAILLVFPAQQRLILGCIVIATMWLAAAVTTNPYLDYWGSDITVAFALGLIVWKVMDQWTLPATQAWLMIVTGMVALALPDLLPEISRSQHVQLFPNIGAALIVAAAIGLERKRITVGDSLLKSQGDVSYSLYLLHPFIIQIIGKIWIITHLNATTAGLVLMILLMVLASGFFATKLHTLVERPFTEKLRAKYDSLGL